MMFSAINVESLVVGKELLLVLIGGLKGQT